MDEVDCSLNKRVSFLFLFFTAKIQYGKLLNLSTV